MSPDVLRDWRRPGRRDGRPPARGLGLVRSSRPPPTGSTEPCRIAAGPHAQTARVPRSARDRRLRAVPSEQRQCRALGRRAARDSVGRRRVSRRRAPSFDALLRQSARAAGVPIVDAVVRDVELGEPSRIRYMAAGGETREAEARMVLDCSGRAGIVARHGFRRSRRRVSHAGHRRRMGIEQLARRRIDPDGRRELRHRLGVVGAAVVDAPAMHGDDRSRQRQGRASRRAARRRAPAGLHARARRGHGPAGAPRRGTSALASVGNARVASITRRRRATGASCSSATPRRSSSRCRRPASRRR